MKLNVIIFFLKINIVKNVVYYRHEIDMLLVVLLLKKLTKKILIGNCRYNAIRNNIYF